MYLDLYTQIFKNLIYQSIYGEDCMSSKTVEYMLALKSSKNSPWKESALTNMQLKETTVYPVPFCALTMIHLEDSINVAPMLRLLVNLTNSKNLHSSSNCRTQPKRKNHISKIVNILVPALTWFPPSTRSQASKDLCQVLPHFAHLQNRLQNGVGGHCKHLHCFRNHWVGPSWHVGAQELST